LFIIFLAMWVNLSVIIGMA